MKRPYIFILLLLLTVSFFSFNVEAASKKTISSVMYSGRKWVNLNDVARFYGMRISVKGDELTLFSKYYKAEFNLKGRSGAFNGVKIFWFFSPVKLKNVYYLSEQDFLCLLDPLIRKKSLKGRPVRTIMLDAGHGGKDTGAIGVNKKKEKDITLAIVMKLRRKLIKLGYGVTLTRSGDTFPTLDRRVTLWEKTRPRPDIFISIHCNAAGNAKVHGIETFAVTPQNTPSTADKKIQTSVCPGNRYNRHNTLLAYCIQSALNRNIPDAADRGVKHARFFVIRNVDCPAVLIETGFVTNSAECTRLSSDAYQEKVATAILRGILNYAAQVR